MHRLKKWFGVKDFDGRSDDTSDSGNNNNQPASTKLVLKTENKISTGDQSNNSVENIVTPVEVNTADRIATDLDLWLRARVPLEPGECLSCKIIGTTTILMLTAGVAPVSLRLKIKYNTFFQRGIVNLITVTNCLIGTHVAYSRWNNVGIFSPKVEGEDFKTYAKRVLQDDDPTVKYFKQKLQKPCTEDEKNK